MVSVGSDANSLFLWGLWKDAEGIQAPSQGRGQWPGKATRNGETDPFKLEAVLGAEKDALQTYVIMERATKFDDNFLKVDLCARRIASLPILTMCSINNKNMDRLFDSFPYVRQMTDAF
jgi:hypothetical protein